MNQILHIHDVSKSFVTERGLAVSALEKANLEIYRGEFVCIVGPSGCGKSTLLRIISGLERADGGQTIYNDRLLEQPHHDVGMVFQEYSVLPWRTVLDNVCLGLEFLREKKAARIERAKHYLGLVGMTRFAEAFPYELSGGMRQRVAIARALATDPQVLLMDEPFGALDAHTRILMQKELLRIWRETDKTVILVTHSVDEAVYLANRIVVMTARPGRIREVINVGLEHPRDRSNPEYARMTAQILDVLEEEVVAAGEF
ncbi:MAG: ABC transporter ATP-binding protein [Desulfomicrobium sp.]|jgi:ABC-type nitrate/sulfonate/bicarbonate transport system ATPase subunit|nr:ABC transporter ATP-binding protein [Desulfomicrobium sp.]